MNVNVTYFYFLCSSLDSCKISGQFEFFYWQESSRYSCFLSVLKYLMPWWLFLEVCFVKKIIHMWFFGSKTFVHETNCRVANCPDLSGFSGSWTKGCQEKTWKKIFSGFSGQWNPGLHYSWKNSFLFTIKMKILTWK